MRALCGEREGESEGNLVVSFSGHSQTLHTPNCVRKDDTKPPHKARSLRAAPQKQAGSESGRVF